MKKNIYLTINHLELFGPIEQYKVGDKLILKKDLSNEYDDEAILVYNKHKNKCGYVANSPRSVARGTYSAGRIYDHFNEELNVIIRFILEESLIVEVE